MVHNIGATAIRFTPDEVAELNASVNQDRLAGHVSALLTGLTPRGSTTEEIELKRCTTNIRKTAGDSEWRDEYMPC